MKLKGSVRPFPSDLFPVQSVQSMRKWKSIAKEAIVRDSFETLLNFKEKMQQCSNKERARSSSSHKRGDKRSKAKMDIR